MKCSTIVGICVFVVVLIGGLGVGLFFVFKPDNSESTAEPTTPAISTSQQTTAQATTTQQTTATAPTTTAVPDGPGAVATSSDECTDIAVAILRKGGSAVDSAISATLCQGVTVPQSSGLGGGLIATVYIKENETFETINSREVAPAAAFKDMYATNAMSVEGGLAIAVPGELKGLEELHKKYGKLSWEEIVQPVIELAENGYKVNRYMGAIFADRPDKIKSLPLFKELFTDPENGELYKEGDVVVNQKLADTLKVIAQEGADAIHGGGSLAQILVDEIQEAGGIITMEDLSNFEPKWGKPIESKLFNGDSFYAFPLPTTGHVLNFIINILNGYNFHEHSLEHHLEDKLLYHRIAEAFKFGFAKRTKLGDEMTEEVLQTIEELGSVEFANGIREAIWDNQTFNDFEHYGADSAVQLDYGTSHISILAPNGDAVALTTTINFIFGAYVMSESTGIIFNNEMNDFSIPVATGGLLPAPANFIAPGKSPVSSMSPFIVLNDNKEVKMVVGGAGGLLIMTAVVQVILWYLYLDQTLETSIAMSRMHHQLQPMRIRHEPDYDPAVLEFLRSKGHTTFLQNPTVAGFASVIAIGNKNGTFEAGVDPRRGGKVTIF